MTKTQFKIICDIYNEFPPQVFQSLPAEIKDAWYRILYSQDQEKEFLKQAA